MSRLARLFVPGLPQIVTLRGNNRCTVFHDETDCLAWLGWLREALRETGVKLHAWVLMPDHLHLLVSAPDGAATGRLLQHLGRRYVRWFNQRHQRSGTLWEGRYRSTVVEPATFLLPCYRYIESNPVRSGLVTEPGFYRWSSCRHHLGLEADPLVTDHPGFWALGNTPFDRQAAYRRLLDAAIPVTELERIRYASQRGWLLGDADEASFDAPVSRRTQPLPKGRPRAPRTE